MKILKSILVLALFGGAAVISSVYNFDVQMFQASVFGSTVSIEENSTENVINVEENQYIVTPAEINRSIVDGEKLIITEGEDGIIYINKEVK